MATTYRVSPRIVARVVGGALLLVGVLVLLLTLVVAWLELPPLLLLLVAAAALVGAAGVAWAALRSGWVVRLTDEGYVVRLVRGVGTSRARWRDVEDAVTADVAGAPCVVLRLLDGRTTTIPVELLAIDRDRFVRELQRHLDEGRGYRRL